MKKKVITISILFNSIIFLPLSSFSIDHNTEEFDDWVVNSNCTKRSDKLCYGYYLEPKYPFPLNDNAEEQPVIINSDELELVNKGSSKFQGHVVANQGNKQLTANKAYVVRDEKTGQLKLLQAEGNVKITEPDLRVNGTKAYYFYQEKKRIIYYSKYRIYSAHAYGISDSITTYNNTRMELPNASYTTCAPNSNVWKIKAKKAKFNKETGRGEAWHSILYIKNAPIFYWPYVNFPIDDRRKTGFLMPELKRSSKHGATLITPFYWNLAPNYDATITPYFMSERFLKIDSQFRYLTDKSTGEINFNFLPKDKKYKGENKFRYSTYIKDKTKFNKNFNLEIDYTKIGDDDYLYDFHENAKLVDHHLQRDLSNPYQNSVTTVLQKAQLQYRFQLGTINTLVEQHQNLYPKDGPSAPEVHKKLPEINFQSNTFDLPYNFKWGAFGSYTSFKIREMPEVETKTTGTRYHAKPFISYPIANPGWFFKPKMQVHIINYKKLNLSKTDLNKNKPNQADCIIPTYNMDAGLIFEKSLKINKKPFIQTLEPRIYYLKVPYKNQEHLPIFDSALIEFDYYQAFRDNRYSGIDRVGEANQLGMGIESKFFTSATNTEKAKIGISRIIYFKDRTNHLNYRAKKEAKRWSPIAATGTYHINDNWNITGNLVKENLKKTKRGSINVQYICDPLHVINAGYQFIRSESFNKQVNKHLHTKKLEFSSAWEIIPQMRLLGRINYDINLKRTANMLLGAEFHGCCTIIRIVHMRNILIERNLSEKKYDHTIALQFVLKGFASSSNLDRSELRLIPGYEPKDHEF